MASKVPQNWAAVGATITERLAELPMQQNELAAKSNVSVAAIREIQRGIERHRRPRMLREISVALDWPENHLENVLQGRHADDDPSLRPVSDMLTRFAERLDAIENHLGTIYDTVTEQLDILRAQERESREL
jgi:transcriptional regulator with XRE-family HTH domain